MKVAILTDTHYGARKNSKPFHDYFKKFYSEVFFPYLKQNGITTVIHLGDAFDNRRSIDYQSLEWAKENVFDPLSEYNTHILVGNHDCYFKNTNKLNSLDLLLDSYSNIKVYSEIEDIQLGSSTITLIPWINPENQQNVFDHLNKTNSKIVMGHLELNGFQSIPGHVFTGGIDPSIFSKFKAVYSGHFHHQSEIGNIKYLGNTYQMFWNDYRCQRGFHVFDTESHSLQFIENPFEIFKKIYYDDSPGHPVDYKIMNLTPFKDCYIKVIVENKNFPVRFENFINRLNAIGVHDVKIIEDHAPISSEDMSIEDCEDTLTILTKYIDDLTNIPINKDELKSDIKSIYSESFVFD